MHSKLRSRFGYVIPILKDRIASSLQRRSEVQVSIASPVFADKLSLSCSIRGILPRPKASRDLSEDLLPSINSLSRGLRNLTVMATVEVSHPPLLRLAA